MGAFFKVGKKDSKYELTFYDQCGDERYYSLNILCQDYLYLNTTKVLNTLCKEYNATINTKEVYSYRGTIKASYAFFEKQDNAIKAVDWLNGILLSNEIKGFDVLAKEAQDKKEASYAKRVNKKYDEVKKFEGEIVNCTIDFNVDLIKANINITTTTINKISRKGNDKIVIETTIGTFEATYMSFQFDINKLTILNAGQSISFEVN